MISKNKAVEPDPPVLNIHDPLSYIRIYATGIYATADSVYPQSYTMPEAFAVGNSSVKHSNGFKINDTYINFSAQMSLEDAAWELMALIGAAGQVHMLSAGKTMGMLEAYLAAHNEKGVRLVGTMNPTELGVKIARSFRGHHTSDLDFAEYILHNAARDVADGDDNMLNAILKNADKQTIVDSVMSRHFKFDNRYFEGTLL